MTRPFAAFERDLFDLASGVSLLYMGPDGSGDAFGLADRMIRAMESSQHEEVIHVAALMLPQLMLRLIHEPWMSERWAALSREYHTSFCEDCRL